MASLFRTLCTKLYRNRSSFIETVTRNIQAYFLGIQYDCKRKSWHYILQQQVGTALDITTETFKQSSFSLRFRTKNHNFNLLARDTCTVYPKSQPYADHDGAVAHQSSPPSPRLIFYSATAADGDVKSAVTVKYSSDGIWPKPLQMQTISVHYQLTKRT